MIAYLLLWCDVDLVDTICHIYIYRRIWEHYMYAKYLPFEVEMGSYFTKPVSISSFNTMGYIPLITYLNIWHRGALLFVTPWQCIRSFVFYICEILQKKVNITWTVPKITIWAAQRKNGPQRSCGVIEKWRHTFAVKKLTRVCLIMLSGLQSLWRRAKTSESCKFSELPPDTVR